MTRLRVPLLVAAGLAAAFAAAYLLFGPGRQGAPKYPVTGRVTVNGRPAAGMVVRFVSADETLVGQDRQPVAVADADGRFVLSSFGGNDGAAEGEYVVTFFWPTNPLTMDTDRLKGRFVKPAESRFRVTVPPRPTDLPPFDLVVPAGDLLPGVGGPGPG